MPVEQGSDNYAAEDLQGVLPIGLLFVALLRAWRLTLATIIVCVILALGYLATTRPAYEATATIGPVAAGASSAGTKSLISAYLDGDMFGPNSTNFTKFLQVLSSSQLAEVLDKKYNAMDIAFPGRDPKTRTWPQGHGVITDAKNAVKRMLGMRIVATPPTPTRFAAFIASIVKVQKLGGDNPLEMRNQNSIVSLKLDSRERAVTLLTRILTEADNLCREDQISDTKRRIAYLKDLIDHTPEVSLRESLQQIMTGEEQMALTVQANKHYSFDMIDPPNADNIPVSPRSGLTILASVLIGFLISTATVLIIFRRRMVAAIATGGDPLAAPFPDPFRMAYRLVRRIWSRGTRKARPSLAGE